MDKHTYFHSAVTSPYITHAAFLCNIRDGKSLAIVRVREDNGEFVKDIKVRDLGELISKDYLVVGYNFNGIKP